MLNIAMIGFGGIAHSAHLPAYSNLEKKGKIRLVAACDIDPSQFQKKHKINIGEADDTDLNYNIYTDLGEMLSNEKIDMIDICLPTYLHADITVSMLNRGYHVLCEKPMAISYEKALQMIEAKRKSGRQLMIGQCLRFAPEYLFLKEAIEENTYGRPVMAVFRRMSGPATWGWENWFMDYGKSGGCILDMHIHDVDIVRFLFGEPDAASCVTKRVDMEDEVCHSRFFFKDGPAAFAIGDWTQAGIPFTADYRMGFEKATVVYEGGKLTIYPRDGELWSPKLDSISSYEHEIEFFTDSILTGASNTVNPPESAATTVKLVETLRRSARAGGQIVDCKCK